MCREREICQLQWDWEVKVLALAHMMVFIIPGEMVKNGDERLVVCNSAVKLVIESQRGKYKRYVFTYKGNPVTRMLNTANEVEVKKVVTL